MTSIILYRFRSYKNFSKITFEGDSLNLWELRYEIVSQRRMNSRDFDLIFYDADTDEKVEDEYLKISKNSRLIIERIPLWMSSNKALLATANRGNSGNRVPPDTYRCYKCGQKGHFIQYCTNEPTDNKNVSGVPKHIIQETGEIRPQAQEWKKQMNLQHSSDVPEDLKCNMCKGLLNNAMVTSCVHFFCDGCAFPGERCTRCRKTVLFVKESGEKRREVEDYLRKNPR